MNLLCKFFLGSRLCFVMVTRVQAQDGQSQVGPHHDPRPDQLLHDRFYGRSHLCAPPPDRSQPGDTVFCFALGGAT